MSAAMRILGALLALALSSCVIYGDGGDDAVDPPDPPDAGVCVPVPRPPPLPPVRLINPATLACVEFTVPTGGCGNGCGRCTPIPPPPPWAPCESQCTGLDKDACAASDVCHVAVAINCGPDGCGLSDFLGCFEIQPPIEPAVCADLDAYACANHRECTSLHDEATLAFVACVDEVRCAGSDEPSCIGNSACEPVYRGSDCTCIPDSCTCASQEFVECRDAR
jgi:hypothetical protein